MKTTLYFIMLMLAIACGKSSHKKGTSIELIKETKKQDSIFTGLLNIASSIPTSLHQDSLAFLVLPVQASCPACRKKTIDSIIKHQDQLLPNHYIIISANGGRKTINS